MTTEAATPAAISTNIVDLASLDLTAACNQPIEIQLEHPTTGDKLDMFISVLGRESDNFKEVIRSRIDTQLAAQAKSRNTNKPRTVDQGENEAIELLVACTTGWRNFVLDGKPIEFNVANAKMVFKRWSWIRAQVDTAVGDIEGFMKT